MLKMAENSAEERRKRARVCEARSEKSAREREKAEKESKRAANEKKIGMLLAGYLGENLIYEKGEKENG